MHKIKQSKYTRKIIVMIVNHISDGHRHFTVLQEKMRTLARFFKTNISPAVKGTVMKNCPLGMLTSFTWKLNMKPPYTKRAHEMMPTVIKEGP